MRRSISVVLPLFERPTKLTIGTGLGATTDVLDDDPTLLKSSIAH
jgi:hypothetical protein